jgi:hypothetical protein
MTGIGQVVPLAETQFDAITAAASARAVFAAPVFEADGTVCEVGIYSNGELAGTVFRQRGGGLKIWTENRKCEVADAAEAVRYCGLGIATRPCAAVLHEPKKGEPKSEGCRPPYLRRGGASGATGCERSIGCPGSRNVFCAGFAGVRGRGDGSVMDTGINQLEALSLDPAPCDDATAFYASPPVWVCFGPVQPAAESTSAVLTLWPAGMCDAALIRALAYVSAANACLGMWCASESEASEIAQRAAQMLPRLAGTLAGCGAPTYVATPSDDSGDASMKAQQAAGQCGVLMPRWQDERRARAHHRRCGR